MERYMDIHSFSEIRNRFNDSFLIRSHAENAGHEVNRSLRYLTGSRQEDWRVAKGLEVLDLGCGSQHLNVSRFGLFVPVYETPDYCRFFAVNGASVTGVDIGRGFPEDEGVYSHVVADIVDAVLGEGLSSIPALSGKTFDIIHSFRFMGEGMFLSPDLDDSLAERGISTWRFYEMVEQQAAGMLKENGILHFEQKASKLVDGQLLSL